MKVTFIFIALFLLSFESFATVNCSGVPKIVYAGAHGPSPSEQSFWVVLEGSSERYIIGQVTNELAQARYSMALAALASSSNVVLQFYYLNSPSTCSNAIADRAIPSAMYIEK